MRCRMENTKYPNIKYNYSDYSGYPIYTEYFNDVKTMTDLAERIKEIPNSVLDILCYEVSMTHHICRSPDESCIRYVLENSVDDNMAIYPIIRAVEHEFFIRNFPTTLG